MIIAAGKMLRSASPSGLFALIGLQAELTRLLEQTYLTKLRLVYRKFSSAIIPLSTYSRA